MGVTQEKQEGVETGLEKITRNVERPASYYGARHTQIILLFLLMTLAYGMRINLSVGIVAMTDPTVNPDFPTYEWDNKNVILSSFFWGYIIPQIGAGQLAKAYGARWFLAGTMIINSLFCILIPFMAELGSWGVMLCRIMQGFAQGFFCPCCHTMLSKWVPPSERARLGTFVYAGTLFGTVLALPITGWLADSSLGWPSAFYLYGAVGLLWTIVWIFIGKNSPAEHKGIDTQERNFIEASLGQSGNHAPPPTPWKAIFTSLPLWAILISQSGHNWGFFTLLTNTPTYMAGVLNFDITSNGLLSAGPYFAFWILSFMFSAITDYVIVHGIVSVVVARKVTNSIGLYIPAVALLTLGIISDIEDITGITLALLFIAVAINSASFCGYNVNHMDISPNHAGTLMGITNGCSTTVSIIAPLIIEFIVSDETDPTQWAVVFYIAAGAYIIGNTFYVLFASGSIQPWDSIESEATIVPT